MIVAIIGSKGLNVDVDAYIPSGISALITGNSWGGREACTRLIVEIADLVVAIWDGVSEDTRVGIDYARSIGKIVWVHKIEKKPA
ncbi:MAG: hypothetical protein ACOX8Q_04400 [Christensenellales bacterium]